MSTYRTKIEPGRGVRLRDHDPASTHGLDRTGAESLNYHLESEIASLQELLYAARLNSVLIVLQGMDTSGKDGTIKKVMEPVHPLGVRVEAFKVPTPQEAAHDFLWRVHKVAPERGFITIFNRSHYEDVLVPAVHDSLSNAEIRKRYRHIVDFERMLSDHGTILIKFFLHISEKQQERRLLARERASDKAWKLSEGDWVERKYWKAYQQAYERAIEKTSTSFAPWHVVPADKKWFRNYLVSRTIVSTLKPYRKQWLASLEERGALSKARLKELRALRPELVEGIEAKIREAS
jgi:PPK2 family polyphosphate:nucleotide phosphotransferase